MLTLAGTAPAHPEESAVANEVWRSRAALARQAATELREQMRVGLWVAERHAAYTRWLLDEARGRLELPPREPATSAAPSSAHLAPRARRG